MSAAWPRRPAERLVHHDPGVRQGVALARRAGAEQELAHRGGQAHAHRGDVAADELHGVVDGHARGDRATRAVDVQPDVLARRPRPRGRAAGRRSGWRSSSLTSVPSITMRLLSRRLKISAWPLGPDCSNPTGRISSDMPARLAVDGGGRSGRPEGGVAARGARARRRAASPSALDAAEDDGHPLVVGHLGADGEQPGQARRAGGADRRCPSPTGRARAPRRSPPRRDDRPSPRCRRPAVEHAQPVVGLVVEDPVGGRARARPPTATCTRPSAPRPGRRRAARRPLPGPRQRRAARGLHGVQPGRPAAALGRALGPRTRPARRHRPGRRRGRAARPDASPISQPIVRPPSRQQRVLRALHAERHRARGDGLAEAVDAGSPGGSSSRRGQTVTSARSRCSASTTDGSAHGGTNTSSRPVDGRGERRRGECGVAARGDGQAAARDRAHAEQLGRHQVEQDREQVPGLVAPGRRCRSRPSPTRRRRR